MTQWNADPAHDPKQLLLSMRFQPSDIKSKAETIYRKLIEESPRIEEGNFTAFSAADLDHMFRLYNGVFFNGLFDRLLRAEMDSELTFEVSRRMTRAGGKTTWGRKPILDGRAVRTVTYYRISVSAPLLWQTFADAARPASVGGIVCNDRLEALQRIMEHEIIHLLEILVWRKSSCAASNFQTLVANFFGHTVRDHRLITLQEVACEKFGIHVGTRVRFAFKRRVLEGIVNRISKRATVLVEDPAGRPFSNGKTYETYYIPLDLLEIVDAARAT
jgi:hypothetical protein